MSPAPSRWLHRYALVVVGATFVLVVAGASVTSTGSGLSVPDWPLSFGTLFPPMVGGVLYEHGHRMIAGAVLLLTTILTVWLFRKEERAWVRKLGLVGLLALVAQALLGGITVLLELPPLVSVSHAALAQAFFAVMVSIALVTSPGWREAPSRVEGTGVSSLRGLALFTTGAVYVQILIGAVMRHTGAGLAIPDFPLAFGRLVPPVVSPPILIHYAHRLGAVAVLASAVLLFFRIARHHASDAGLRRAAHALAALVVAQIILGGITIWTRRAVVPTTAHVALGAAILAVSLVVTLRSFRLVAVRAEAEKRQEAPVVRSAPARRGARATVADHAELAKPRIVLMVLVTTLAGFYLGALGSLDWSLLANTLVGTALVVGSANALNQYLERDADALMRRTRNRPLPAGRMSPREALASGTGMVVVGGVYLAAAVHSLAALVALAAWANYVFVYTPLKKRSSVSTLVGAVSGALPPVVGWVAVRGELSVESLVLFWILFLWQLPHFLAIAWMYREDYARAGFPMLPVVDPEGRRTSRQIVAYGTALVPMSLLPTLLGLAGGVYFFGALVLGVGFLAFGVRTAFHRTGVHAKQLFFASLLFLPALLALMMLDKGTLPPR